MPRNTNTYIPRDQRYCQGCGQPAPTHTVEVETRHWKGSVLVHGPACVAQLQERVEREWAQPDEQPLDDSVKRVAELVATYL